MPLASFFQPSCPQAAVMHRVFLKMSESSSQPLAASHYSVASASTPEPLGNLFGNNQIEISFLLLCMTTCTYLSAMMGQNFSPEPRKHYDTKSRIGKNGPREIKWIVFLLKHTNPGVTRHQLCGMVCWSYKVNNTKHTRIHSLILHGSDMCRFHLPWFN